jgi:glycosyltransferase involved in cell wall biosynthesis
LQGWIGENGKFTWSGKILNRLSRLVARQAQQVIIVSKHLADYLPQNIPVSVIPGGIDFDLFHPIAMEKARRKLNLPIKKRLILFPADPDNPIKRFSLANEACQTLQSQFDWEMIVLKDIPHHTVPLYMNACDAMLVTSKHEGSPTVVKEALACNLPIVSVDVGDVKKWINQVEGCILCTNDEVDTISAAIKQVLDRQQRIKGRAAVEQLDWDTTIQKVINVYQDAVNG